MPWAARSRLVSARTTGRPSPLERGGDAVLGRLNLDLTTRTHATREEDGVHACADKGRTVLACADDHLNQTLGKVGVEQALENGGDVRGVLRWLPEHGIARQDCGDDRSERDGDRKVPRGDQPDDTLGVERTRPDFPG